MTFLLSPKFMMGILMITVLGGACNHLFYYPDDHRYTKPTQFGIPFEEGFIDTKDGQRLHYWNFAPTSEEKGTILHFHGNAQNMTSHALYVIWMVEHGYRVITFDYRGYGQSSGSPNPEGLYQDGQAVLDFVCRKQYKNLFVLGQSLGGVVAMTVLGRDRAHCSCGLILESTFASYRDIARDKLSQFLLSWPFQYPLSFLVSDQWAPKDSCQNIKVPTLIIHGDQDRVIPFQFGQELESLIGAESKSFWTVEGGGHTSAFVPESPFRAKLIGYLDEMRQKCSK